MQTGIKLNEFLKPYFDTNPHLERYLYEPLEVMLNFNLWNDILNFQVRSQSPIAKAFWHYSRGVALAAQRKCLRQRRSPTIQPQRCLSWLDWC